VFQKIYRLISESQLVYKSNNKPIVPISKTEIKGILENVVEIKLASCIRFIPKKNHTIKSRITPKIRKK